ncbi:MAG: hypothetical protein IKO06_03035, partial [Alphaproteobacteria bacterium]|nr:hypothetical protein [Alphaproteobacteria bacterium]
MTNFVKIISIAMLSVFLCSANAFCVENAEAVNSVIADNMTTDIAEEELTYDEAKHVVDGIMHAMQEDISKEDIDSYVTRLSKIETVLTRKREAIEKDAKYLQKQLEALSAEPQELEDESITKQREEISQNLAAHNKIIKEADLLIIQIEDLTVKILNLRNQKIYGDLITKQSAFINPVVFFSGVKAYMIFFWDVVKSPLDWYENLPESQRSYALFSIISMVFILMIALIMAIMLRRFILRNWGYKADITKPTFNRKLVAAVAVAIARGLIFMFVIIGCIIWMKSTKIFEGSFLDTVLMTTAFWTLLVIVESTVSRVTFAPQFPQWRLLNVTTEKAARFTKMIFLYILCNAVTIIQVYIAMTAEYSSETQHFLMIICCAVTAFFLMWFAKICFESEKTETGDSPEKEESREESKIADHKLKLLMFSYLFCSLFFAISLFGYPELSLFVLRHTVFSLIFCGVFEVLRRSLLEIIRKIIYYLPLMKKYKNNKKTANKVNFWLKATINPLMLLILVFSLLNLWGLPGDFILIAVKKILFGFKIGGIQISLIAVILGIAIFFGSLTTSRIIKNKLAASLQSSDMDDGIKHSLVSGVGFVGFIISILLAIVSMGIDLTNLAFIAGALSVGIGFGLQ